MRAGLLIPCLRFLSFRSVIAGFVGLRAIRLLIWNFKLKDSLVMEYPSECYVRWMIRRDMPMVLAIEEASFEFPWSYEEFIRCLRHSIGMVAEMDDEVVGYAIYEIHRNRLHLLKIAVNPNLRRCGIGSMLMDNLAGKLYSNLPPHRIMLKVRETNLDAQLFFKKLGYRAISVLRDFYEDTTEDAYLMEYRQQRRKRNEKDYA